MGKKTTITKMLYRVIEDTEAQSLSVSPQTHLIHAPRPMHDRLLAENSNAVRVVRNQILSFSGYYILWIESALNVAVVYDPPTVKRIHTNPRTLPEAPRPPSKPGTSKILR